MFHFHIRFLCLRDDLSKWAYAQTAVLEGCLTLAPGSEAAVWDNCSAKFWRNYGVHVSPKMCGPLCIHLRNPLQNQWQNDGKSMKIYVGGCLLSHVGSKWHLLEAILAQDDREDRFFIDFWNHFGIPKWYKNRWKNKVIFRRPKKLCFLRRKVPKAPKCSSKRHPKSSFFWNLTKLQNRAPACRRS